MLRILLLRFWPVWVPVALYLLWYLARRRRAARRGEPLPRLKDGPWIWVLVAMAGIGVLCALAIGIGAESNRGSAYVPAHIENGTMIPGRMHQGPGDDAP